MIVLSIEKEAVKLKKSEKNGKEYATVVVEKHKENTNTYSPKKYKRW